MNLKRATVLFVLAVVCLALPTQAFAVICTKRTTTYWGYDHGDGPRCNAVVWPYTLIVVGEKVIECDGTTTQWGIVCTSPNAPTVTYEECPPCDRDPQSAAEVKPEQQDGETPAVPPAACKRQ